MIISNIISECIIVHKKLADTIVLVKNRDRAYSPELEVVHELLGGVEAIYLHDKTTDWSEGMNEHGIAIVNTALMVGFDEHEKKLVKKKGVKSKDGTKIREVLSCTTLQDAVQTASTYRGGVNGHSFITDGSVLVSMEKTSKNEPKFTIHRDGKLQVRTNHGEIYPEAGYTEGDNYLSSMIRKTSAIKSVGDVESPSEILSAMRQQFYDTDSNLNMRRDTKAMSTSSQLQLNIDARKFILHYFPNKVSGSVRYVNKLPNTHTPVLSYEIKSIEI
jgi:hypothetical protein